MSRQQIDQVIAEIHKLIQAASDGRVQEVTTLLDRSPGNINEQHPWHGITALQIASIHGHPRVAQLLLDRGANKDLKDNNWGRTALQYASESGQPVVAQLLLDRGADKDIQDNYGNTALHLASHCGHTEVAQLLLDRGANIHIQNNEGSTALHIASMHGRRQVAQLLLDRGADKDIQDNGGKTALHWASHSGRGDGPQVKQLTGLLQLLLDRGANKDLKDNWGKTALDLASINDTMRDVFRGHTARVAAAAAAAQRQQQQAQEQQRQQEQQQQQQQQQQRQQEQQQRQQQAQQQQRAAAAAEAAAAETAAAATAAAEAAAAEAAAVEAAAAERLAGADRGKLHHALRDATTPPVEVCFPYLQEITGDFNPQERVGGGAFGDVFRGFEATSGDYFAVKRISPQLLNAALPDTQVAAQRSYDREITALSRFSHPHIVRLIAFSAPPTGERVLVYEFLPRGSLADNLTDDALAAQLTWKARVRVLQQVATALNFMHRGGAGDRCFHRDVKSANICLTATLSAKLIDCGLAMFIAADDERAGRTRVTGTGAGGGVLGTPGYMSPEYGRTGQYSEKAEVFSFGVVLLEVLTGRLQMADGVDLYDHYLYGQEELGPAVFDRRAGQAPQELSLSLCALARECLEDRHQRRIGLAAVMRQLNDLVKLHCAPTVEEGLLGAAREEMERLRLAFRMHQLAVAPAVEAEPGIDCVVCMDPFPLRRGLRCGGGGGAESHFTCAGCIDGRVRVEAEGALESVRCCGFRCGALYEEQALAVHCSPESYALYQQARVQGVQAATEREVVGRFEAERLRREALSEADRRAEDVRKHIIEEILTLKCPRCSLAFLDFDACFALSCASDKDPSYGCKSHYCAFCLTLCGEDAHRHVAQCPHNINPGRDVFGNVENFDKAQRTRRLRLLREYLGPMGVQQRDRALQDCQQDLRDLGLTRNDLV